MGWDPSMESSLTHGVPALVTLSPLGSQHLEFFYPWGLCTQSTCGGISELQGHLCTMMSWSGRANLASFFRACQTPGSRNTKKPSCQSRPLPQCSLQGPWLTAPLPASLGPQNLIITDAKDTNYPVPCGLRKRKVQMPILGALSCQHTPSPAQSTTF